MTLNFPNSPSSGDQFTGSNNYIYEYDGEKWNFVKLVGGDFSTSAIQDGAVTTAKIADANVTTAKIADDAVTTVKILDDAVTRAKLASTAKGSILQVKQSVKIGRSSVTGFNWTSVSGLSVDITPVSASSKILVFLSINLGGSNAYDMKVRLRRDTTVIGVGDGDGSRPPCTMTVNMYNDNVSVAGYQQATQSMQFLDTTVSTTSQVTYSAQVAAYSTNIMYVNRSNSYAASTEYVGTPISTITVMEVAA